MILLCASFCMAESSAESDQSPLQEKSQWTFVPLPILAYSTDTGIMGGLFLNILYNPDTFNPDQKTDSISFVGIYTQKHQWTLVGATDWFFDVDRYRLSFSTAVSRFPSNFYGIGPDTDMDDAESYTPLRFNLETAFRFKIVRDLYLGPRVLFTTIDMVEIEDGEMLDTGDVPGSDGATFLGGGPYLTWDKRDNTTYPHRGFVADAKLDFFRRELGSSENHTQLLLDYRHFFQLYEEHVLGLELFSHLAHGTVPFQVLPALGGSGLMRGYYDARFRDKVFVATQIEYRFPIYWRFGGVVFGGIGQVAPRIAELTFEDLKVAGGLGIRFAVTEDPKINVRLDFAFSPEGFSFYVNALEAF
jgi:outer membrane protein assembly factor BamA